MSAVHALLWLWFSLMVESTSNGEEEKTIMGTEKEKGLLVSKCLALMRATQEQGFEIDRRSGKLQGVVSARGIVSMFSSTSSESGSGTSDKNLILKSLDNSVLIHLQPSSIFSVDIFRSPSDNART